jgi:hypothetical protein
METSLQSFRTRSRSTVILRLLGLSDSFFSRHSSNSRYHSAPVSASSAAPGFPASARPARARISSKSSPPKSGMPSEAMTECSVLPEPRARRRRFRRPSHRQAIRPSHDSCGRCCCGRQTQPRRPTARSTAQAPRSPPPGPPPALEIAGCCWRSPAHQASLGACRICRRPRWICP